MPLVGTRGGASARAYGFTSGAPEVLGGMVLVAPTSVDKAGTGSTATINGSGSVTFDVCTSLSLNGVFTADYDNYMIVIRSKCSSAGTQFFGRVRASGTDSTATTDYNHQSLIADGTSVSGNRRTNFGSWYLSGGSSTSLRDGTTIHLFGPFLSQPTAYRATGGYSYLDARIEDCAGTHELSTSYDGMTFFPDAGQTMTGLISVYGLVGA